MTSNITPHLNQRFGPSPMLPHTLSVLSIVFVSGIVGCGQPTATAPTPTAPAQTDPPTPGVTPAITTEKMADQPADADEAPKEAINNQPAKRKLPMVSPVESDGGNVAEVASEDTNADPASLQDDSDEGGVEIDPEILAEIEAQERAYRELADTFPAPPAGKLLSKLPDLWIDPKNKSVLIDGYVTMREGPLEMLACPVGSKEHESVVALFASSSEVHAALLAVGAQTGTPVQWTEEDFLPPTGQTISVWITWRKNTNQRSPENTEAETTEAEDSDSEKENAVEKPRWNGAFEVADARTWVRNTETLKSMKENWVFAGSSFWSDPVDGKEYYSADGGDMICVSNFSTAMLDVPFDSSANAGSLLFEPFKENIPERGTPVRVVLTPLSVPTDDTKGQPDPAPEPPGEEVLPIPSAAPAK